MLSNFYGRFHFNEQDPIPKIKLAVSASREQLFAFFTRPTVVDSFHPVLRDRFAQVFYELSDNAFLHGKAKHFELSFDGSALRVRDDGTAFNPLVQLDPGRSSASSHIGSFVVDGFRRDFRDFVGIAYRRAAEADKSLNVLEFTLLKSPTELPQPEVFDIPINVGQVFGRRAAERLAQSIVLPTRAKEIVLTVGTVHNLSALFEFINQMLARLPAGTILTVSLARTVFDPSMNRWFNDERLRIQPR